MELDGKVVVVTGAARGIGRCIAETVATRGAHTVIADVDIEQARAVADGIRAAGQSAAATPVDVADPASADQLIATVLAAQGQVDALVNNAGIDAPAGFAWETEEADWRRIIEVDLNGAWWCSRAVIPHLMARKQGRIVNISSISARVGSPHISPAYHTAKAGLIGLTVSLSTQLEPHGILVNAITPGATGSTGKPFSAAGRAAYLESHPLGFGGPQPIADAVGYLLGPGGDWVSGSVLNVSGGDHRGI
jgi:NAD(P)-dependent dehydrogenase (short-subunit alcohol dehydrogenase family)